MIEEPSYMVSQNPNTQATTGLSFPIAAVKLAGPNPTLVMWDRTGSWTITSGGVAEALLTHPWARREQAPFPMPQALVELTAPREMHVEPTAPRPPDPQELPAAWLHPYATDANRDIVTTQCVVGPHRDLWAALAVAFQWSVEPAVAQETTTPVPAADATGTVIPPPVVTTEGEAVP